MSTKQVTLPPGFDESAPILAEADLPKFRPASEMFAELGIPMPKPVGRPKAERVKQSVTIRLHPTIVEHFKAQGPGWQTRINEVLLREITKKAG
jgi:uncharacterized protein (DUF4415 family)